MTKDGIVFQAFSNNSQNNVLHNFVRHWSEANRPVITRVFFVALLENGDIYLLPVDRDLPRFPRPLKNKWGRPHEISNQDPRMNPIWPHRLMCIRLMQQILHKFGVDCEFIIPTVMVFQLRAENHLCGVKLFCWCAVGFLFVCFLLLFGCCYWREWGKEEEESGRVLKESTVLAGDNSSLLIKAMCGILSRWQKAKLICFPLCLHYSSLEKWSFLYRWDL